MSSRLNSAALSEASWEELRREVRRLESEVDLKLVSFSKYGTSFAQSSLLEGGVGGAGGSGQETVGLLSNSEHVSESMAMEIEQLLGRLSDVVDHMSRVANSGSSGPTTLHAVQRHRDRLQNYLREFKRTRSDINACREHAELLSSVRSDISQYKTESRMDFQLRERTAIQASDQAADQALEQARAARESLNAQRGMFGTISGRLNVLTQNALPAVSGIMSQIRVKKQRDLIIMVGVISTCIFLILWYAYL